MQKVTLLFFFFSTLKFSFSQQANFFSRSELGLHFGKMYYIGELNPFMPFYENQNGYGILYRFGKNTRMSYRLNYTYGQLQANDADSKIEQNRNRNLNFETKIHEIVGGIEFYFKPYQLGNDRYSETFYFIIQGGLFYMNPKTLYNGELIALRSLGTEGQLGRSTYNLFQFVIPLGIGYKMNLGKIGTLNLDLAIRKTFTDYIDDIGSTSYANLEDFANHLDPDLSYALSNRSLDGSRTERRANPVTNDWYVYSSISLAFKLGTGNTCWDFK